MKFLFLVSAIIFFLICESLGKRRNTNSYLNVMQIIRKFGYPAESHEVKTADGYLLQMHRIPHGKYSDINVTNATSGNKPPIFMQHGLLGTSFDFLIMGSKNVLPFLLADLGLDVWLGNVRGNTYSRAHVNLIPNEIKFWNFTWHESAIYDIPAQIDFICNHTKQEKIIYIGYSMGTTMFFAMTSFLPEYRDKIQVSFLLAAVAYCENIRSPLIKFLTPFMKQFKEIAEFFDNGAFMKNELFFKFFGKILCEKIKIKKDLCMNIIFLIVGSDPKEFDENLMPSLINHYPAGYSLKAVIHFSQLVKSGKFCQYDYGESGNLIEYNSPTPPEYNLSSITTPLYIYEGKNDYLSTLKDVKRLTKQLPNLRKFRVIEYSQFSHLDFIMSHNVKKWLYDELIEDLISSLQDENNIK